MSDKKLDLYFSLFFQGKTGDWKNHFTPELNGRIEEWIDKNLNGTDLKFVTELVFQDWILRQVKTILFPYFNCELYK